MHRRLKKLLHAARGESQFVVAVFLDIRGFSSWMTDSSRSAVYLKSVYTKILDEYFADADFFKPTGDGLLVILNHDAEKALQPTVRHAVQASIDLVRDFPHLTDGDLMVNFDVPQRLGIGIARESATRLVSGRQTLDYSGHPLNLAARLMDLARPSGVVLDGGLGLDLLPRAVADKFVKEQVYVKGIADDEPMNVYALKDYVTIPEFNRYPINRFRQHMTGVESVTLKELKQRGTFVHPLDLDPASRDRIRAFVRFPKVMPNGSKHPAMRTTRHYPAVYLEQRGRQLAKVDYQAIVNQLVDAGVKPNWKGEVWLEYPVRDRAA